MGIKIFPEAFDPFQEIHQYQSQLTALLGKYGATSIFIGSMRDFNEGDDVKGMYLEHYPEMTEKQLNIIIQEAKLHWPILDCLVIHRVGQIAPGEPIMLIAIWSSHRGDACGANRFILEALKSTVPFWKKELLTSGEERWVEKNHEGYTR